MANDLAEYLSGKDPGEFEARPMYSSDGDFLTFFFRDEDCAGERIDDLLTVYRSSRDNDLVGCKIKGVRRILSTLGDFGVMVRDRRITLGMLFLAGMAVSTAGADRKRPYEIMGQRTRDIPLDAADLQLA